MKHLFTESPYLGRGNPLGDLAGRSYDRGTLGQHRSVETLSSEQPSFSRTIRSIAGWSGSRPTTSLKCPLNQHVLADALGLSEIHVNRILRQLRERGLLTFRARNVHDRRRNRAEGAGWIRKSCGRRRLDQGKGETLAATERCEVLSPSDVFRRT